MNNYYDSLSPSDPALSILYFLASAIIIYFGLIHLSDGLIAPFSERIVRVMTKSHKGRWSQFSQGFFLSQIIVRKNILTGMIFELANAGLTRYQQGIWLLVGGNLSNVYIFYFLTLIPMKMGMWFFVPACLCFVYHFFSHVEWPFKLFLGLAFLFLGQVISTSFGTFSLETVKSFSYLLFVLPLLISFFTASPLLAILPFVPYFYDSEQHLWVVILTHIGASLAYLRKRKNANIFAKRIILFQVLYEFIGVLLLYGSYRFFLSSEFTNLNAVNLAHYFFILNFSPIFFMIFFEKYMTGIVLRMLPDETVKENFSLQKLGDIDLGDEMIPSIGISQIQYQIEKYKDIVDRMFSLTKKYIHMDSIDPKTLHKIKEYERVSDNMREEILHFIKNVMTRPLNESQAKKILMFGRVNHELEKISDYLDKLATYYTNFGRPLPNSELRELFYQYFNDVMNFFEDVTHLEFEKLKDPLDSYNERSHQLRERAHDLREQIRSYLIQDGRCGAEEERDIQSLSDMIVAMRKVRSHTHNIFQSFS